MEGSAGNHGYYFANGEYKYILYVNKFSGPLGYLTVYRTNLNGYYEVKYPNTYLAVLENESYDHELLLTESIVNSGTESRYQALLNRLRECSG